MKNITINNITFNYGDEITFISEYDQTILQGKINIDEYNNFYVCHNNERFDGRYKDIDLLGFKFAYHIRTSEIGDNMVFHRIDIEKLPYLNDDILTKPIRRFLGSINYQIVMLSQIKLGVLDKYDSVTPSEEQGFVVCHSKKRKKKMSIKLGRLISKLSIAMNELVSQNPKNFFKIKDDIIEKAHNIWMSVNATGIKYEILTGDDILKGYTKSNYVSAYGTLQNSCMGDMHHLLDLYTKNPDKISLLVFYDREEETKISGRCLLWKADDGNLYHDRIYHTKDWFEHVFTEIAKKLGYTKLYLSNIQARVTLENLDFRKYPYLDTFYAISFKTKSLIHDPNNSLNIKYELRSTNGQIIEKYNSKPEQDAV